MFEMCWRSPRARARPPSEADRAGPGWDGPGGRNPQTKQTNKKYNNNITIL